MSDDQDRERLGRIARTASYRFYGDTSATADDPWPEEESKDVYESIAAAVDQEVAGRYRPLVEAARQIKENWENDELTMEDVMLGKMLLYDALDALAGGHEADAGPATGAGGDDGRD